jgi:hypothetical protein
MIQVDQISRIRSHSGQWDYYTDEDIIDGHLVFECVSSVRFDPPGLIPNDYICRIEGKRVREERAEEGSESYSFEILIGSVGKKAVVGGVDVTIIATSLHLEDPLRPGIRITE